MNVISCYQVNVGELTLLENPDILMETVSIKSLIELIIAYNANNLPFIDPIKETLLSKSDDGLYVLFSVSIDNEKTKGILDYFKDFSINNYDPCKKFELLSSIVIQQQV